MKTASTPEHGALLRALGKRIREYRQTNHLSQVDLASAAGIDRAYLSGVENGKHNVTVGALMRISQALKVELAVLVHQASEHATQHAQQQ